MALQVTTAQDINYGSAADIDNLATGSTIVWLYIDSLSGTGARFFITKWGNNVGWGLQSLSDGTNSTKLRFFVERATQDAVFDSVANTLSAGKWICIAATWDVPANDFHLYTGDLTTRLAEVSYALQQAGSGGALDDAAETLMVNDLQAFSLGAAGRYAIAMLWNRVLPLSELALHQFRPYASTGTLLYTHFGYNGTGTQVDWSGNARGGTIAGSPTVAAHVPLGPWFGFDVARPYIVAVPTIERSATDGLFLADVMYKALEFTRSDSMLMRDDRASATDLYQLDRALITDTALIQAVRQIIVTDAIYLKDDRFSSYDKTLLDTVLVADILYRTIENLILDGLLVKDDVTTELITEFIERTVRDGLFLVDFATKTEEHVIRDSLLLSDAAIRELVRQLTDSVLVVDQRYGETNLTQQDQLLLSDVALRIIELLQREGLYAVDSATQQKIEGVIAVLVYARLLTRDILGISTVAAEWMGRRVDVEDVLGIETHIVKRPRIQ